MDVSSSVFSFALDWSNGMRIPSFQHIIPRKSLCPTDFSGTRLCGSQSIPSAPLFIHYPIFSFISTTSSFFRQATDSHRQPTRARSTLQPQTTNKPQTNNKVCQPRSHHPLPHLPPPQLPPPPTTQPPTPSSSQHLLSLRRRQQPQLRRLQQPQLNTPPHLPHPPHPPHPPPQPPLRAKSASAMVPARPPPPPKPPLPKPHVKPAGPVVRFVKSRTQ